MNKSYTSRYFEEIETYTNAVTQWNDKIGPDFQKMGNVYLLPERCRDISDNETCKVHKLHMIKETVPAEAKILKIEEQKTLWFDKEIKNKVKTVNSVMY